MAEDGSENADVVAAAIAKANHRLGSCLIGDSNTGSEVLIVGASVSCQIDALLTGDAHLARKRINPTALTGAANGFGLVNLPPKPEVNCQLVRDADSVLSEEEKAWLSFVRVRRNADVASEGGHVAEKKCRQTRPANSARTLRLVLGEGELASAVD